MNILVTGGCGFIGSNLSNDLAKSYSVHVVDDLSTGKLSNLNENSNISIYKLDICDSEALDKIITSKEIDAIVHLAALASVQKCEDDPQASHAINLKASQDLLKIAQKRSIKKFVFASSAAVYGDEPTLPKHEDKSEIKPISVYGRDKLSFEQELIKQKQISGIALRFFNVFGKNQDPSSPYSGVLSIFLDLLMARDQPEVSIYGDGKQSRDFVYIKDVIACIKMALNNPQMEGSVYNVATSNSIDLLDVIQVLSKTSGKEIAINFKPARHGDIVHSLADINKIGSLGYKPQYSFEEGLKEYFEHLQASL